MVRAEVRLVFQLGLRLGFRNGVRISSGVCVGIRYGNRVSSKVGFTVRVRVGVDSEVRDALAGQYMIAAARSSTPPSRVPPAHIPILTL